MKQWVKRILFAGAMVPVLAQAQLDLTALDRDMAGPRAHVLVLGTVHLRSMPASFNPASLGGVLDKLAKFKPEIITIETESGEECDMVARHVAKYGADYCASVEAARLAVGLDAPAAMAEADKMLKAWPEQATAAQRRRLAALFLASYDTASAYVQWLQLAETERRAGDGLNEVLIAQLTQTAKRNNESYQIAACLAARLGLQRVHAVDNHTGDRIDVADIKAFVRSIESAWASGNTGLNVRKKREDELTLANDLLPLYRYINEPEGLRIYAEANIIPSMRAKSAEAYPQIWVAGWEIRNMRMVANIRETFRERPGARVLSVVGVSHKPWFDSWLGQMQGVDIVNVADVLK
ncbi:MAG: DUF5694 domain-containing protein [Undibacterium umbellatum]|uniref:DUF5694 domain-containing protein n=1 Tax=Undibacterium umbellatum TaxID=2762300 RepID=UPI003BB4EDA5